jgi:hypothetical protein
MPHIRFSILVDTEDEEPSRVVRRIEGTVYRYAGESDVEQQIGNLCCFLVQPGLAEEKDVSLFEAMDSISDETAECYESVFDPSTDGWNADIEELFWGGPIGSDLLFMTIFEISASGGSTSSTSELVDSWNHRKDRLRNRLLCSPS